MNKFRITKRPACMTLLSQNVEWWNLMNWQKDLALVQYGTMEVWQEFIFLNIMNDWKNGHMKGMNKLKSKDGEKQI